VEERDGSGCPNAKSLSLKFGGIVFERPDRRVVEPYLPVSEGTRRLMPMAKKPVQKFSVVTPPLELKAFVDVKFLRETTGHAVFV
jgi:hypothetical protein